MTDKTVKPIPKSLHTVTVLVKLARHFRVTQGWSYDNLEGPLDEALRFLGYATTPDTHELRAAALKQLEARS